METTTTTTQVSSSVTTRSGSVGLQMSYVLSIPGILLLVSIVLDIVIAICGGATPLLSYFSFGKFIIFVGVFFLIVNGLFYVLHVLNVRNQLAAPWTLIDIIVLSVGLLFHFIAFCVACDKAALGSELTSGLGAAAFFTLANCVLLGILLFFVVRQAQANGFSLTIFTRTSMTTTTRGSGEDNKPVGEGPPAYYPPTTGTSAPYSQY